MKNQTSNRRNFNRESLRVLAALILAETGLDTRLLYANQLAPQAWEHIWKRVRKMSPARLGQIAALGRGARIDNKSEPLPPEQQYQGREAKLYYVHCGTWLGKYDDGLSLLRQIACTAIIACMADLLNEQFPQQS